MPPSGATGLHFVVSTGVEKADPELRKFIRSHVMQGKNRGKVLPPRKKKMKGNQVPASSDPDPSPPNSSDPNEDGDQSLALSAAASDPDLNLRITITRKLGSGLSTICFADTLEPGTIEVVLQLSSIAKQLLFPLERCMFFDRRGENWIAPLAVDPAYLHAMIFTSQFYFDALMSGKTAPVSRRSLPHLFKTLRLLRERMENGDDEERLSDSTAAAIMGLVGHAHLTGDNKSAKYHMEGLYKIVYLRGGFASFKRNAKLLVEILRNDIGIALHSGSKPAFFNSASREPFLPYPDLTSLVALTHPITTRHHNNSTTFLDCVDDELIKAWKVISDFCTIINFAVDSELRISTETFLDTMTSVMYRLLDMQFEGSSKNEVIRLGLLAFLCSVFLQWKHLGMSYPHFTSMFRSCVMGIEPGSVSSALMVWLLMVGAVSVFGDSDDMWLKPLLRVNTGWCGIDGWSEMQELLKEFMWIGLVYDKPGKHVFESVHT